MSVYGPMVPVTVVEDLVTDTLQTWLPSYLGEIGAVIGKARTDLPNIRSWGIPQGDLEKRPEQQLPALNVISSGTAADPEVDGDGLYSVAWNMDVAVIVSANTAEATNRVVKAYATAIAACVLQQPLGEPVIGIDWQGDSYDDLTGDSDRTMLGVTVRFVIYAQDVLQRDVGPTAPEAPDPRDESPDLPTVDSVELVETRLPVAL